MGFKFPAFPGIGDKTKAIYYEITESGRAEMRAYARPPQEMQVLMALNDGPKTSYMLATRIGCDREQLRPVIDTLLRHDLIQRRS